MLEEVLMSVTSRGIVYILANPGMFDPETGEPIVKIGVTQDLPGRLAQLYSAGVPFPFQTVFACEVENYGVVERALHNALKVHRVNLKREFFNVDPNSIIPLLENFVGFKDITPQVEEDVAKLDDSTEEVPTVPEGYETYYDFKPLIVPPDGFRDGYFCIRVSNLHRKEGVSVFKQNGKVYYKKDLLRKRATIEGILKPGV
jgi:hypothetical protein